MKGQNIIISEEECSVLYGQEYVSKVDYNTLIGCIVAATRQQWVKLDQWKKWYSAVERLRLLTGSIVV